MRYQIGQSVPFVHFEFTSEFNPNKTVDGRTFVKPMPWRPWRDRIKITTLQMMICKSHHKVPNAYDPEQNKCHDGFIFEDPKGQEWFSQYPTAHYGQISDHADGLVRLHMYDQTVEEWKKTGQRVFEMYDAFRYLDELHYGLQQLKAAASAETLSVLDAHYQDLIRQMEAPSGKKVITTPLQLRKLDGGFDEFPNIWKHSFADA